MEVEHCFHFTVFKNFKRKKIKWSEKSPSLNNTIITCNNYFEMKSAEKHH